MNAISAKVRGEQIGLAKLYLGNARNLIIERRSAVATRKWILINLRLTSALAPLTSGHFSDEVARKPELPLRPAPGWVDAPIW